MMLSRSSMMVLCFKVKNTDTVKRQKVEKEKFKRILSFLFVEEGKQIVVRGTFSSTKHVLNKLSTLHKVLLNLQIFPLLT